MLNVLPVVSLYRAVCITVILSSVTHCFTFSDLLLVCRRGHLTDNVFEQHASNVLSDTELRWFWISWLDGVISYGRGSQPGIEVIGSYVDPSPSPVNYMSISSYGSVRGYWVIPSKLYQSTSR